MSHFQFTDYFSFQVFGIFRLSWFFLFLSCVCRHLCELADFCMVIRVELNKIVEVMQSLTE